MNELKGYIWQEYVESGKRIAIEIKSGKYPAGTDSRDWRIYGDMAVYCPYIPLTMSKNDENIVDYSISYGKLNVPLTVVTKVGKISNCKIDTLNDGDTYWFQITPILTSGAYGTPSNIILYKVPSKRLDDTHTAPQLKVKSGEKKTS